MGSLIIDVLVNLASLRMPPRSVETKSRWKREPEQVTFTLLAGDFDT